MTSATRAVPRHTVAAPVGSYPGLGLWTLLFFVYLYAPIVVLVAYSFNRGDVAQLWEGFSWRWYPEVLVNADIQRTTLNSLVVAGAATACATVMATLAALTLSRGRAFRGQTAVLGIINLPLLVPEIVTAVATLILFSVTGLQLGLGNLVIAHTVLCVPFAFLPINARLQGMGVALEQAAQDLYANDWQVFRYVTLPMLAPGMAAGAMLSFIISLDDFLVSLMVSSAGTSTLPIYIYSMIRVGVSPVVNAVSTLLLAASILLVTVYWRLSRKKS